VIREHGFDGKMAAFSGDGASIRRAAPGRAFSKVGDLGHRGPIADGVSLWGSAWHGPRKGSSSWSTWLDVPSRRVLRDLADFEPNRGTLGIGGPGGGRAPMAGLAPLVLFPFPSFRRRQWQDVTGHARGQPKAPQFSPPLLIGAPTPRL
jgi:hypothetical protein